GEERGQDHAERDDRVRPPERERRRGEGRADHGPRRQPWSGRNVDHHRLPDRHREDPVRVAGPALHDHRDHSGDHGVGGRGRPGSRRPLIGLPEEGGEPAYRTRPRPAACVLRHLPIVVWPGGHAVIRRGYPVYILRMRSSRIRYRRCVRQPTWQQRPRPYRPGMDTLVQLANVTKPYDHDGSSALADVTMDVRPGESVAVMGPSRRGKSPLLNLIAGLDRPTAGTITVGGERVDTLRETGLARFRRRQIGMIFQFFNLLDDMTVLDNVLLPAQLAGMPTAQARARAGDLLTALRIEKHRN